MTGTVVVFCDWSSRDRMREACAAFGHRAAFVEIASGARHRHQDGPDVLWVAPGTTAERLEGLLEDRGAACVGVVPAVEQLTELGTELAIRLELPHNPLEAVRMLRDKRGMKNRWSQAAIPTARCVEGRTAADAAGSGLDYPMIIKPVFGAGSVGVRLVRNEPELLRQVRAILRFNRTTLVTEGHDRSGFLVEELVSGAEYAVDVVVDGEHLLQAGVLCKGDPTGPEFPDRLYCTDPGLPTELRSLLIDTALAAVRSCGMRVGAAHVEIRVDDGRPVVIEAAARPGAGCGLYATLESGYGDACFEALVGAALPQVSPRDVAAVVAARSRPASSRRAFLYNVGYRLSGRLSRREVPAGFGAAHPEITEVVWRRDVGDYLPLELTSMAYLAWFRGLLSATSPLSDCEADLACAAAGLDVSVG